MLERDESDNLSPVEKANILFTRLNALLTQLAANPSPDVRVNIIASIQSNYDKAMVLLATEGYGEIIRDIDNQHHHYHATEGERNEIDTVTSRVNHPLAMRIAEMLMPDPIATPSFDDFSVKVPREYRPLLGVFFVVNGAMVRHWYQTKSDSSEN